MATKSNTTARTETRPGTAGPNLTLTPSATRKITELTNKASAQVGMLSDMMVAYRVAERQAAVGFGRRKRENEALLTALKDLSTLLFALNGQMHAHINRVWDTLAMLTVQLADATEDATKKTSSLPDVPSP
jgi:hypothetical protein